MGRSSQTFGKKEREKKKLKKRQDKLEKKEERKSQSVKGTLENMMAYLDEDGNITDTPPDPDAKKKKIDPSTIQISTPKKEEIEEESKIREGKITYFNESKGYGFIRDFGTQDSVFVHVNGLAEGEEVGEGDKVTFEVEQGVKGPNAVRVKRV